MAEPSASAPLRITVLWSGQARQVQEWQGALPAGSTVADALRASGIAAGSAQAHTAAEGGAVGLWGHHAALADALRDGDRVEIYRPLRVDPKVARRERFMQQGSRSSGLFAKKRPGAKAGY